MGEQIFLPSSCFHFRNVGPRHNKSQAPPTLLDPVPLVLTATALAKPLAIAP